MILRRTTSAALAAFAAITFSAHSATFYADQSVPSSGDGTSWATAFKSIQEGINAAQNGDEVIAAVGTYIETLDFTGKNITVRSTDPAAPGVVAMTVIEPTLLEGVRFRSSESRAAVIAGFTITSGHVGISCVWSSPTIRNNVIVSNTSPFDVGGGVSCYYSSPLIEDNIIASNTAPGGAAIACEGAEPVIANNLIIGNGTDIDGGGILCVDCSATIARNRIIANSAQGNGGGICCLGSRAEILNNLICSNVANSMGGGVWSESSVLRVVGNTIANNSSQGGGAGGIQFVKSSGDIVNCILWGNGDELSGTRASYTCIEDDEPDDQGEGNMHDNPGFDDPDGADNVLGTADDDYRFSGESPCVDKGSFSAAVELSIVAQGLGFSLSWAPGPDILGQARVSGNAPDMGCIEYQSATPVYLLETSPDLEEWSTAYEGPGTRFFFPADSGRAFFRVSALEPWRANVMTHNAGDNQEDLDLLWNDMASGCVRAFFFEQNCDDAMGNGNATGANLTYDVGIRYYPQGTMLRDFAANFNGDTSYVKIGNAADIQSLTELTIAFWTYCRSDGEGDAGKVLSKTENTRFETTYDNGTYVGLYAKIACDGTPAESFKNYRLGETKWHHVAFTYSQTGDRKIHIFIDGTEVTGYNTQIASAGNRVGDAGESGFIGNDSGATRGYDGLITTFLIYNRVLSADELKWLAGVGDLQAMTWELRAQIDATKVSHGMIGFRSDDEFAAFYNALPVFRSKAVKPTLAINVGLVGDPYGRMTLAQIWDFVNIGGEIISHSMNHLDPITQNETDLRYNFSESRRWLEAEFGMPVRYYCWPDNAPHAAYRAICAEYYDAACDGSVSYLPEIPMLHLGHHNTITGSGILEAMKAIVDDAYTNNRYRIFLYHDQMTPEMLSELSELIDYIRAKPVPIVTFGEAVANMKFIPPKPLYRVYSVRLKNIHASAAKQFYQVKTLVAGDYTVSFRAYKDGTPVTSADVLPLARAAGSPSQVRSLSYQDMGGGMYFCSGRFTATAGEWDVGLEVGPGRTLFVNLLACRRAGD